jgi:hypothetical protein
MKNRPRLPTTACLLLTVVSAAAGRTPAFLLSAGPPEPPDLIDRILALPVPPPDWEPQARQRNAGLPMSERDWFEGDPPDDAAYDILLAHWREHCWDEEIRPAELSTKLRQRLLEAAEEQPYELMMILRFLPETPDAAARVERMYKAAQQSSKPDNSEWFRRVRAWLAEHNDKYHGDLIELAQSAHDGEFVSKCACLTSYWIDTTQSLRALSEKHWPAARPILFKHAEGDQPCVAALSLGLLYQHAATSGSQDEAAPLREKLKALVENGAARDLARALACEALMATEWEGRDEWFLSLFRDKSLSTFGESYDDPPSLAAVVRRSPDYWIPRVATLVAGRNRTARNGAIRCLLQFCEEDARADALRPLLPWLSDPKWARDSAERHERAGLVAALGRVILPESIPGLTWVVDHDDDCAFAAAEALAFQGAKNAIPALKTALLREPHEYRRRRAVRTLLTLRGFSTRELLDAVEAYAAASATKDGEDYIKRALEDYQQSPRLDVKVSIGYWTSCYNRYEETLGEDVVRKLVSRANEVSKADAVFAARLWSIISRWGAKPVDVEMLRRLASGNGDADSIHFALQRRESLRTRVPEQLAALCNQGGMTSGVALILLGDARRYPAVLASSDRDAQRALLACARLIREPLPVPMVADLLKSKDERVAKVAWMYLEREDSPAARKIVLARYPGQAKILGACWQFEADQDYESPFEFWGEDELRRAVLAENGPDEIIALLSSGQIAGPIQRIIYVRGDKAELRIEREHCDYTPRTLMLSEKQWQDFKSFLTANFVDDLAPFDDGTCDGVDYEYVHVTKDGGRRVFMNTPAHRGGLLYDRLVRRFDQLGEAGECNPTR